MMTDREADFVRAGNTSSPLRLGTFLLAAVLLGAALLSRMYLLHPGEDPRKAICAVQLKLLAVVLQSYAGESGGAFPLDLQALVRGGHAAAELLRCPESTGPVEGAAYVYVQGQRTDREPRNVLAYEAAQNHDGEGGNALFIDGHTEWFTPDALQAAVSETLRRLGRAATPSVTTTQPADEQHP